MVVKTRKYQLSVNQFIKIGMAGIIRKQWWVILIAVAIMCVYFVQPSIWWIVGGSVGYILYLLFWLIQFAGLSQMEQGKFMFEKLSYEITSQQILLKLNPRQGMPIKWEQIKRAVAGKDFYVLYMSKVQFIYLPYKVFNNENDRKFFETILKRKGLMKEK